MTYSKTNIIDISILKGDFIEILFVYTLSGKMNL